MLTVEGLRSRYGRIEVLHGVDLQVRSGEIVTVVGANGAGKTTLLKCLSGIQPISDGRITFRGENLAVVPAHGRLRRGLAQSPEGRQIFTSLTVEENLRLGAFLFSDERVAQDMAEAYAMLAIARALMGRPSCLLLDEPSMGLAPLLVAQIFDVVKGLRDRGVTVLLVEQNAYGALKIADRGYVMETGRITIEGAASELIADPRIREAYLGL